MIKKNKNKFYKIFINGGAYKNNFILLNQNIHQFNPIISRIKQDIFNILQNYITFKNSTLLDLFSGSGSFGIEAISFGFNRVIFNDKNKKIILFLNNNLNTLNINKNRYKLINKDYIKLLNEIDDKFNVIFIDAPFKDHYMFSNSLNLVNENKLLKKNGIVILRVNNNYILKNKFFTTIKEKKYKNQKILFLSLKE